MDFRKERHSITDLKIHWLCVVKYRKQILTSESLDVIQQSFKPVALQMNFKLIEFNGEADHVHAVKEA